MNLLKNLTIASTVTLMTGCVVIADSSRADHHERKELSLTAANIQLLDVDAGAGSLSVVGYDDVDEIQVVADIYTDKEYTDNYILDLYQRNGRAYLVAKNKSTSGIWNGSSPRINVTIRAPKHLALEIEDGSGRAEIRDFDGNAKVKDGSGDLLVSNLGGDLRVDDGSGDLTISEIKGDLNLEDGSGDTDITSVGGSIDVDDGSGDLSIRQVTGYTRVDDGSGDLSISNVSGKVTIDDGSGSIYVRDVAGLNIIDAGSGSLKVSGVEGGFNIDS